MRSSFLIVALGIALMAFAGPASAQYELHERSRVGIAMAMVRPADSALTDIQGMYVGPVVQINTTFDDLDRATSFLSIGWFGAEDGYSRANFVPVKATYIKRFGRSLRGGWYAGGSLEAYFTSFRTYDYDPTLRDYAYADESGNMTGVGLVCGLEFGGAWYAEASYDFLGKLERKNGNEVNFGGLTLSIGSRLAF